MPAQFECLPSAVLARWLSGRADGDEADRVARHVETCADCAATLLSLRDDDTLASALRPPLTPDEQPFRDRAEALIPHLKQLRPPEHTATWGAGDALATRTAGHAAEAGGRPPVPGETVAGYVLLEQIGAGGMGVVFRAEDPVLRREIAVKLIRPGLARTAEVADRFLREAQALAALEHEHVVSVYRAGEEAGVLFLVMPLLRGGTLQDRLGKAAAPLPVDEVLRVGREIAEGLAAAHAKGMVHRDIKPGNIWLCADGSGVKFETPSPGPSATVKVLDFGLVHALGGDGEDGKILGTPSYMAPEQAAGEPVDARADLFSLGCVLYHMATGKRPFTADDVTGLLLSVCMDEPDPPRKLNPLLPPALEAAILKLLRKKPGDRIPTAAATAAELRAIEESRRPRMSRRRWLAGTAAAGLLGALAYRWLRPAPVPEPPPPPGVVTFDYAEPDSRIGLKLGDEPERVVDLRAEKVLELPAGDYAVRALAAVGEQRLLPERVVVAPGERAAVALQLVGLVAGHRKHRPHAACGTVLSEAGGKVVVLSAGTDRTLVAWTPHAGEAIQSAPLGPFRCCTLSPDGKTLAVGVGNTDKRLQEVWFFDATTLTRNPDVALRLSDVGLPTALAYSPDGKLLFVAQSDGTLSRWEVALRVAEHEQQVCPKGVHAVAVSPDGKWVVAADADGAVTEFTADKLNLVHRSRDTDKPLRAVAVAPDGTRVVAAGDDGAVRVWDRATRKAVAQWDAGKPVTALAVSADATRVVTGDAAGALRVWNIARRAEVIHFAAHAAQVTSVAFARDGRRVVSGGADGDVKLWSVPK
jgi:sugar lactone lactonase YvrE